MRPGVISVVGASGGVGSAAVARLAAWGVGPLRVGGRNRGEIERLVSAERDVIESVQVVDVDDTASLDRFCAGSRIVVDCTGPAASTLPRVAAAAGRAGADFVAAAGDDTLLPAARGSLAGGRVSVVSAGMVPGLSGVLPRCLATRFPSAQGARLTVYAGGCDSFTEVAARDYVAADDGFGTPFALWRAGQRRRGSLAIEEDVVLEGFPRPVVLVPFLTTEIERVATDLGLAEARSYSVFDGKHVLAVLRRRSSSAELRDAARLDLFGRDRYQTINVRLANGSAGASLVLSGRGANDLTATTVAITVGEVLAGTVPPGAHHADRALDPHRVLDRLAGTDAITRLTIDHDPAADRLLEDGVL